MTELFIFAQAAPDGISDILVTYGPFAPFAALLLWLLKLLWADNKDKEAEIKRLSSLAMDRLLPPVLEATRVLTDVVKLLENIPTTTAQTQQQIDTLQKIVESLQRAETERTRRDPPDRRDDRYERGYV